MLADSCDDVVVGFLLVVAVAFAIVSFPVWLPLWVVGRLFREEVE